MTTHVYRLDIAYPEGSDEDGWEPEGEWWKHTRSGFAVEEFTWPAEHGERR